MSTTTIAILPFVNMSSDEENEYFCDGMTEEIINALAKIDHLKVTSRTSSFFFKGKNMPIQQVAEELNVEVILEGSIRKGGNQVRITAQLIQAADDFHFWSETWDRKLENVFEVQDEISLEIASKVREQFGHFEISEHLVTPQTTNIDAYQLSLKARHLFNKWNPEDVKTSISMFEEVIKMDPKHTESYVGLADAYSFMATTTFMPPEVAWPKSVEYTHIAYELDPKNAGVHYLLANLAFFQDCNFQLAFEHGLRAVKYKPSYPEAQQYLTFLYIQVGDMETAKHHLQLALGIDPLSPGTKFYLGYYQYRSGDFEAALTTMNKLLDENPLNIPAFIVRFYALLMLDRCEEVLESVKNTPESIQIPDELLGVECLAYIKMGDSENLANALPRLESAANNPMSFQAHSYLFLAYINSGQLDEAFALLERSLEMKSSIFLLSYSDPLTAKARKDPRYPQFESRIYGTEIPKEVEKPKKHDLLEANVAEEYVTKVQSYMTSEKAFLNPELNLRGLAERLEIHPNQLSWVINEKIGKRFNEFINQYRINHFKVLAKDPSNSHISLVGLAYESGFNSKTVFNTFFKKQEGITPSQFLKSV